MGCAVLHEVALADAAFPAQRDVAAPLDRLPPNPSPWRGALPEIVQGDADPPKPWSPGTIAPMNDG
jgi:hypothetical protein